LNYYTVKNWLQFQHYKHRNPPWIKLHFEILTSRDWVGLDNDARVLAVACMLIASRNNGRVPDDPGYIKRVAYLNKEPNFNPLISCGFLECASGCLQVRTNALPETETETETETEKKVKGRFAPPSVQEVTAYCQQRKNNIDPESFIDHYTANGWMRGNNKIKCWKSCVRTWEKSPRRHETSKRNASSSHMETLKEIYRENQ
jgi:hypothetical protein